jgi:hypothetical protein
MVVSFHLSLPLFLGKFLANKKRGLSPFLFSPSRHYIFLCFFPLPPKTAVPEYMHLPWLR